MSTNLSLPVSEFLRLFETECDRYGWIDVRSEGEHEKAALPRFVNAPILTDSERHEVGLAYKQRGQAEAVRLGHELVDPQKPERVRNWSEIAKTSPSGEAIVICWRGGMRSQIAANWMRESGVISRTVQGGFKAVRGELLKSFEQIPELLILSGLTGSGKTEFLTSLRQTRIDLERLANHRGSSFGRKIGERQPAQASFENLLALELRRARRETSSPMVLPVILEDESVSIGGCFLPRALKQAMNSAPCVWIERTVEERAAHIFNEYVAEPLKKGVPAAEVEHWMLSSLDRIERKLGGLETSRIRQMVRSAFENGEHAPWIMRLLELYYDPMYLYVFQKRVSNGRRILFRGTPEECRQWLQTKFA